MNISKGGQLFGLATFLEPALQQILEKLAAENHLAGLDAASFAGRAAWFLGELNAAHPYREGNGRTQREFMREVKEYLRSVPVPLASAMLGTMNLVLAQ